MGSWWSGWTTSSFHESSGSAYHADHIVPHEMGHLLLGHNESAAGREQDAIVGLLANCDTAGVLAVLRRTDYDDQ